MKPLGSGPTRFDRILGSGLDLITKKRAINFKKVMGIGIRIKVTPSGFIVLNHSTLAPHLEETYRIVLYIVILTLITKKKKSN